MEPNFKKELWRKLFHMLVIVFLPIAAISKGLLVLILLILAVLYLAHESYVQQGGTVPILTEAIQKAKRLREREIARAPFLMWAGVVITVFVFPLKPAAAGLLQLAFADVAAALVGMKLGSRPIPYSPDKSWEGTLAFFLMALILMPFFFPFWMSLLLALTGALIESLPYKDWDNLLIPVGVAALASFF